MSEGKEEKLIYDAIPEKMWPEVEKILKDVDKNRADWSSGEHRSSGAGYDFNRFLQEHPGFGKNNHPDIKEWESGSIPLEEALADEKDVEDFRGELWVLKEAVGEGFDPINPDKFSKNDLSLMLLAFEEFKNGSITTEILQSVKAAYEKIHSGEEKDDGGFLHLCAWIAKQMAYQDAYLKKEASIKEPVAEQDKTNSRP